MSEIAVHLGQVGSGTLSALVMTRGEAAPPTVTVCDTRTGAALPVTLEERAAPELRSLLAARGVRARRLVARDVQPDGTYQVIGRLPGSPDAVATVRALPAALPVGGLTLALATCFFHGFPWYRRFAEALAGRRLIEPARLLLLAGDNLYMDIKDEGGFSDGTPAAIVDRYLQHLFDPAVVEARSRVPALTTWDDHEFWNDYPERQPHLGFSRDERRGRFIDTAKMCIETFAADLNPRGMARSYTFALPGPSPALPGISLFVADLRTERTLADVDAPTMMPPDAFASLISWLRGLDRPGVLVLGQPLWIEATSKVLGLFTGDHNPPAFRAQYLALMDAIAEAPWDVLVLSGDVHYSRLLRVTVGGARGERVFHELVSSPLVHIPGGGATLLRAAFHSIGLPQDRGRISDPSRIEYPTASARFLGGTTVPNTFALVRFTPVAAGVRVGVSFEDLAGGGRAEPVPSANGAAAVPGGDVAPEGINFTLRKR